MSSPRRLQAKRARDLTLSAQSGDGDLDHNSNDEAKRAVLYLRVSTPSQVNTDYNPEGISLPAQREKCELKAASLGADIVREFVEPGKTARSIEARPVFQEMMAWLKEQKNIDYIIVYHFSRMFRSTIDAAITRRDLRKYGTRVVSTIVDLGEGPEGELIESVLNAVDQYQSQAQGADIAYKMGAKARNGGTITKAPIGYLNARDTSEGRNVGIVKFDPERADLIRAAFELYATDKYSLLSLVEELTKRGLRPRPGRYHAKEISDSKLADLLRDPYYIGWISHKGELYKGTHEPLISHELFDRVQAVLDERHGRGERQKRHEHYLKGDLWCGRCHDLGVEARLYMHWARGNGGTYIYVLCSRKRIEGCDSGYVDVEKVEDALIRFYGTIKFPTELADQVRGAIHHTLEEEEQSAKLLHKQLTTELLHLDKQEENLLDLAADGNEPTSKIKQRLSTIKKKRDQISQELDSAGERLEIGAELLESALLLLQDPQALYVGASPEQRRDLNRAIFERIWIDVQGHVTAEFKPPFDELLVCRLRDS